MPSTTRDRLQDAGLSWDLVAEAGVESAHERGGGCARPVRLRGSTEMVDTRTGETHTTYSSDSELDGVTTSAAVTDARRCVPAAATSTRATPGT